MYETSGDAVKRFSKWVATVAVKEHHRRINVSFSNVINKRTEEKCLAHVAKCKQIVRFILVRRLYLHQGSQKSSKLSQILHSAVANGAMDPLLRTIVWW